MIDWIEYERTYRGVKNPYKQFLKNNPSIKKLKKSKRTRIEREFEQLQGNLASLQEIRALVAVFAHTTDESEDYLVAEALEIFINEGCSHSELISIKEFIESGL